MLLRLLVLFSLLLIRPVLAEDVIRISYNSDWPPYSYGVGDEVKGVLPDLMTALFEDRLGMKVEHGGFPWVRAQEVVKVGQFDAMVTFPSAKRLEYAYRSENIVYNLRQRPVVQKGSVAEKQLLANPEVAELGNHRICSMIGDGWSHSFYKKHNIPFKTAKDTQACLRLVANGRMDVFLHMEAATQHNMRLSETTDLLTHLPNVMGNLPFTLLVSKKKADAQKIIAEFDDLVNVMRANNAYERLISDLNRKTYIVE